MACSITGYKTFLVCCNIILLFVGASVLILGLKMKGALAILLMDIPVIARAFKAIISTGFFISLASLTGITGACYEVLWLLSVHLFFLVIIVIMEFAVGVTLMVIRTTIETYIESPDCNKSCAATLDAIVLDYALPSSGLMMTIIIVEALMIYSAMQLYLLIRNAAKLDDIPERVARNLQMLHVSPQPISSHSPHPGYSPRQSPGVQPRYSPHRPPQYPSPIYSPKPPEYNSAVEQLPPPYLEVVPSSSPILGMIPDRGRSPRYF